ncbi:ferredoxin [Streptomyces sp. x-19]|uniref:ferredoxin n=1 Tax=Streptomyces sp. x-19 TaxID=2789280 RepID=UPI003980B1F8
MNVVVDLARCQSYGQCVFAAPQVFELRSQEVLEYDTAPSDAWRVHVERARAACPVQAITVGPAAGPEPDAALDEDRRAR